MATNLYSSSNPTAACNLHGPGPRPDPSAAGAVVQSNLRCAAKHSKLHGRLCAFTGRVRTWAPRSASPGPLPIQDVLGACRQGSVPTGLGHYLQRGPAQGLIEATQSATGEAWRRQCLRPRGAKSAYGEVSYARDHCQSPRGGRVESTPILRPTTAQHSSALTWSVSATGKAKSEG